jgi:hypothetical protein
MSETENTDNTTAAAEATSTDAQADLIATQIIAADEGLRCTGTFQVDRIFQLTFS